MPNLSVAELRARYIALTRDFFSEIQKGREPVELQDLQEEIERLMLELDHREKEENPPSPEA